MTLYVGYHRLKSGVNIVGDMTHYYYGRLPPGTWNSPEMQQIFATVKVLRDPDLDGLTFQAIVSRRQFDAVIWATVFVDIPKMCLSMYVIMALVVRGGTGPFYRTLCFEVSWCAVNSLLVEAR